MKCGCLSADPAARYATGAELAADLRRHLTDLPLRGVANRSPAERWAVIAYIEKLRASPSAADAPARADSLLAAELARR